jgi:hypothetical protein
MSIVRFTNPALEAFPLAPSGEFSRQVTGAFGRVILTVSGPVRASAQHEK